GSLAGRERLKFVLDRIQPRRKEGQRVVSLTVGYRGTNTLQRRRRNRHGDAGHSQILDVLDRTPNRARLHALGKSQGDAHHEPRCCECCESSHTSVSNDEASRQSPAGTRVERTSELKLEHNRDKTTAFRGEWPKYRDGPGGIQECVQFIVES